MLPTYPGRKFTFNIFPYGKEERLQLIARGMLSCAWGGAEWQALLCQLRLKQYPGSCHLWFLWRSKCQTIPVCLGGDVPLFNQPLGRRDKETDPLGWVGHLPAKWDICAPAPFKCFMAKQQKSYSSPPSVGCSCCSWPQHCILLRTPRQGYFVWFQSSREDPGSHSKTYYLYR